MAAAKIKYLNPDAKMWLIFIQKVKLYFVEVGMNSNKINGAKRKAVLFRTLGIELFNKYCDIRESNAKDATFDDII